MEDELINFTKQQKSLFLLFEAFFEFVWDSRQSNFA
jgi:hypothetical protein